MSFYTFTAPDEARKTNSITAVYFFEEIPCYIYIIRYYQYMTHLNDLIKAIIPPKFLFS